MNSRTYNAQFITLDFRLLDDAGFCAFMRSAAFAVYLQLRRYVWRGTNRRHPLEKVNELLRSGYLASAVPRETLARKLGIRQVTNVSRHLAELERLGVVRKVRTGRLNAYVLGTWEDRSLAGDGSYVIETFYLEQTYGAEPFEQPRLDDLPPGLERDDVPLRVTSEVSLRSTSDVRSRGASEVPRKARNNKERNREANTRRPRSAFEPVDGKERDDDALYVVH